MNPTELELFLYRHTESESWHLQHPGQLSHLYDKMKQEEFRGEVGYCFDFVNTLKKDMIGMIKETRFTVIPKHHHVDMELNYIYSGSCTFVINGREITLKKGDLCILDSDVWHSATSYKKEHDIVINIVFRSPENQLCTDDFAGHLAHNANLSAKAIMAIAGYGEMARMLGKETTANKYIETAKRLAIEWEKMAFDGDHYKLAFDKPGTWSQKYNLIWDKVFNMNIFPQKVFDTEIPFYLTKQNKYGLLLDSRAQYTKSDWVLWSACMSPDDATFQKFIDPIYTYANETTSRVPISDWHDTNTGKMMNFKARSVVGGYYMKLLMEKVKEQK